MRVFMGLAIALLAPLSIAQTTIRVQTEGHVAHAATLSLPDTARYADAALAASPGSDAYVLGASLRRDSLIESQTRMRAGAVYDLEEIARRAAKREDDRTMDAAMKMAAWVRALPVTGRQVAALDPRVVEVSPKANLPLHDGDILHYPARPSTVRIVGAVARACGLPFEPMRDARDYLADCPSKGVADNDTYYVIQADGSISRQGRALWNRSAPLALAPGAVIYVPLKVSLTHDVDPDLDRELAEFLATQVIE